MAMVSRLTMLFVGAGALAWAQTHGRPRPDFAELLREMSAGGGNACESADDLTRYEQDLFIQADEEVEKALNATETSAVRSPFAKASAVMTHLEALSAGVNQTWAEENRFHFKVLDLSPAVVVKMTFRNRATFSFFARSKPDSAWKSTGALDDRKDRPEGGHDSLEIYPLQRGPNHRPRFLARFGAFGCGSGAGIDYIAYEWNPAGETGPDEIIKVEGSISQFDSPDDLDSARKDPEHAFLPIGELKTEVPTVTLPYCRYSALDTWHNPSLCSVDTYDLSGDRVRFKGRVDNRPDLAPIAQAIEHAYTRDYAAVAAYCASADVATAIVEEMPPFVFASELNIRPISPDRKIVEMGDPISMRFEVEKRGARWLVTSFEISPSQ